MVTEKYHQMIYNRIHENFQKWDKYDFILEKELYTFLHNLKGTAGSIGLDELTIIASEKLEMLNETSEKNWSKNEWQAYLVPIIEGIKFYETNILELGEEIEFNATHNCYEQDFILIIDDDIVFISYMKNVLEKKGYSVMVAHNGKRGMELIYELQPSIVFLDIMLPDTSGFSILKNVKKIKKERMFVTVISSNNSKENRLRAFEMGALDFMPKPIDQDILISYVSNRLAHKKELEHAIVIDELTQVYNRKFMESQLQKYINQINYNKEPLSIAILDLDYFKKVNDTYGHLVGDEVLKGFAALVKNFKREEDVICRYGGEEFVILMPQTSDKEAYTLIERLRKSMEHNFFLANGVSFNVTFSSGLVEATPFNLHPKKMLEEADQALYAAKQNGRNQTIIYDSVADIVKKKVKVRIIVIDDVYIIRNLFLKHFENFELSEEYMIEVMAFSDGISFLHSNWYDPNCRYIILLDWMLPNMDGIEVLKKIREKYTSRDVLVSMLTARIGEEYVMRALENGADDYIIKPFHVPEVSERILRLINRVFS
ncbi:diguanylate cyclase [Lysinibacillus sp. B2A1]|nr:diguanylate cyclase [Lysinibacillus sp. B2A1]